MTEKIFPMDTQYEEYLIDESKYCGFADSISFPESKEEIRDILKEQSKEGIPVTVQGGKTGITGGAVPKGGHIMNLSHMNQVKDFWIEEDGTGRIVAEPGINLIDLRKEISNRSRKNPLFFPADPTETSASIGGVVASGAQGITRILYGNTLEYVESVKVIACDGTIRELCKGRVTELSEGKEIDEVQTVFGKEGITGIISEVTLRLLPKPQSIWGIAFFFEEIGACADFIDSLKEELPASETAAVAAVEYIDRSSLDLIEARKATMTKIKELPDIGPENVAMIYMELHGEEDGIEELAEMLMELAMEYGSDAETAWAVSGESEVEKMHVFRHAAAETVNLFIEEKHQKDVRITKLGMDMLMGGMSFSQMLRNYESELKESGLKGCVFGHALENHLHVNILPENYEEYEKGIELARKWAKAADEAGGAVIGEHGLGKLKKEMFQELIPQEHIVLCRELKEKTDKENMINRGNIL